MTVRIFEIHAGHQFRVSFRRATGLPFVLERSGERKNGDCVGVRVATLVFCREVVSVTGKDLNWFQQEQNGDAGQEKSFTVGFCGHCRNKQKGACCERHIG